MNKYTAQKYFINGEIPQDKLASIQARRAVLSAEICEIDALLAQHNANILKNKLHKYEK